MLLADKVRDKDEDKDEDKHRQDAAGGRRLRLAGGMGVDRSPHLRPDARLPRCEVPKGSGASR